MEEKILIKNEVNKKAKEIFLWLSIGFFSLCALFALILLSEFEAEMYHGGYYIGNTKYWVQSYTSIENIMGYKILFGGYNLADGAYETCMAFFIIACATFAIGLAMLIMFFATSSNAEIIDEHFVSLGKHICLLLFTFGIWYLIWIYKATKYSNFVKDEQERKPSTALLLYIFVPFYSFYWTYKTAQRIDKIAKERNVQSDIATMCLVLAIFVPILPPIFMQDKINQAIKGETADNTSSKDNNISDIEALEKYKELLDKGIITQEEFDAKKKQLLGL